MTALPFTQIALNANGNISPRRFIVGVAASPQKAVQATGSTLPILGASYDKTRFPPNSPSDDGYNAIAGESLSYHGPGTIARVDVGTAVTSVVVPVTADGDGKVVPVNFASGQTTLVWIAGIPLDVCSAGETCRVLLLPPSCVHPALS